MATYTYTRIITYKFTDEELNNPNFWGINSVDQLKNELDTDFSKEELDNLFPYSQENSILDNDCD